MAFLKLDQWHVISLSPQTREQVIHSLQIQNQAQQGYDLPKSTQLLKGEQAINCFCSAAGIGCELLAVTVLLAVTFDLFLKLKGQGAYIFQNVDWNLQCHHQ